VGVGGGEHYVGGAPPGADPPGADPLVDVPQPVQGVGPLPASN